MEWFKLAPITMSNLSGNAWVHALDILVCGVVLRIIFGWLFSYRKLVRFVLTLFGISAILIGIWWAGLPLAQLLSALVLLPILLLTVLSFLPELSRLYAAASRGNIFKLRTPYSTDLIREISGAIFDLIHNKRGALIVLQRQDTISEWVSGGEPVDALVNRALLLSIFDPHSPGHDGATIIRGNRIESIGVVLPLASAEISRPISMGTRHLAGIGLSERCDADVLIVSEEKGTLSHARDGDLTLIPSESTEQLEKDLNLLLVQDEVNQDWKGKKRLSIACWIVAFILATSGSLLVKPIQEQLHGTAVITTPVDARIGFTELAEGYFVEQLDPIRVKAFLRIPSRQFVPGWLDNLNLSLNIPNAQLGETSMRISPSMLKGVPADVMVDQLVPDTINFTISKMRQMDVPVQPRLVGLARRFRYSVLTVTPGTLTAQVKQTKVETDPVAHTQPINLSNVKESGTFTYEIALDLPNSIRTVEPIEKVVVEVEIAPR